MSSESGIFDVVVCGAGPAGLSAALSAAQSGKRVLIAEKLSRPGVKLLASGGGRCNFTNNLPEDKFMMSFGRNGRFMTEALRAGGREWLLDFLRSHKVEPVLEDGIHYFPASRSAMDVRDAFLEEAVRLGAALKTSLKITGIRLNEAGAVCGVETEQGGGSCSSLILACGGMAMSVLGGTSAGLELAKSVGHTIVKPLPAMAPLRVKERWALQGVSLPAASLSMIAERKRITASGEIVFTHDGLSGPAALDLSAPAYRAFERDGTAEIFFSPVENMDFRKWQDLLMRFRQTEGLKYLRTSLGKFMPHALAETLCIEGGLGETRNAELTNGDIESFARFLTQIPLHISALCPMEKAMAMSGGVSLKEVNPKNMESRLVSGLFFAGEMLDLAGPCGGFHIQFAIASGRLAGLSAS